MSNPLQTISELATVFPGFSPKPDERKRRGAYLLLGGRNIKGGKLVKTDKDSCIDEIDRESFRRAIARPGDIIVSTLFDRRKLHVYSSRDPHAVVNNSCAIIRSGEQSDYIVSYLRTIEGQKDFLGKASRATGGAFIPRLSVKNLAAIQIPMLPLQDLARLGDAEIEKSEQDGLLQLKKELVSKDGTINELKARYEEMERFYQNRIKTIEAQIAANDFASQIEHGETAHLEFKSTLRWNMHRKAFGKEIENEVLKTVVAFCNTNGGELLIGVADDGSILGVADDRFKNNDKFLLHLGNLLADRVLPSIVQFVDYEMVDIEAKSICRVKCKLSTREVWLKPDKNSPAQFFVRHGSSSTQLDGPEAVVYIRDHFDQKK